MRHDLIVAASERQSVCFPTDRGSGLPYEQIECVRYGVQVVREESRVHVKRHRR
jgi:hypothetical protein